jgi:hypothetical protein
MSAGSALRRRTANKRRPADADKNRGQRVKRNQFGWHHGASSAHPRVLDLRRLGRRLQVASAKGALRRRPLAQMADRTYARAGSPTWRAFEMTWSMKP